MHVYPRYPGDPHEGRPIDHRIEIRRTAQELMRIATAIGAAIPGSVPGDSRGPAR